MVRGAGFEFGFGGDNWFSGEISAIFDIAIGRGDCLPGDGDVGIIEFDGDIGGSSVFICSDRGILLLLGDVVGNGDGRDSGSKYEPHGKDSDEYGDGDFLEQNGDIDSKEDSDEAGSDDDDADVEIFFWGATTGKDLETRGEHDFGVFANLSEDGGDEGEHWV